MEWSQVYTKDNQPSLKQIEDFVDNPLWRRFNDAIQGCYEIEPRIEHSRCSKPGWNVKYKKRGKSLCTLYPMKGYFIVLVVIGTKEMNEAEFMVSSCTEYIQHVYKETPVGMGQKWLMLEVRDVRTADDIIRLTELRTKPGKASRQTHE